MIPWLGMLLLASPPVPLQDLANPGRISASVVLVRSRLGGIHAAQGSGVVVAPGLVATNAHVTQGTLGVSVHQGAIAWPVTRVITDPGRDLCLLTVPGLQLPVVPLAPEPDGVGQQVFIVGYPGGHGPVVSPGRLRGIWHLGNARLFQSDAPSLPGNSGGGLFDAQGRLLGLTTLTFTPSPRLNFSIPAAWVRDLMERPGEAVTRPPAWRHAERGTDLLERLARDPRNWPAWETAARQWVQDLPGDPNAWLALGLALDRAARVAAEGSASAEATILPEGVEAYRQSLVLHPDPKAWNNLGVALDLLNRFEEAEQAFQAALQMDPGYGLAWMNLGAARMNAAHYPTAIEALQKGLRFHPDDAEAWVRLGHCQRLGGQREAAVDTLRLALRYRPLSAELWLDLGRLLVDLARGDDALVVLARLSELNPDLGVRLKATLPPVRSGRSRAGAASGKPGR